MHSELAAKVRYTIEVTQPDGEKLHVEASNLIPIGGKTYLIGRAFQKVGTPGMPTGFYIGLLNASATYNENSTYSEVVGASEVITYDGSTRPEWTPEVTHIATNVLTPAEFEITTTSTIAHVFLATDNAKGVTSGTLISVAPVLPLPITVQESGIVKITGTFSIRNEV